MAKAKEKAPSFKKVSASAYAHVQIAEQVCNIIIKQALRAAALEDGVDFLTLGIDPQTMEWKPVPLPEKK